MRYKCKVSYVGTEFSGFQSQANKNAIQDKIEEALAIIFGESIRIIGSSRTDGGVHAYGQIFHFDAEERDIHKIKRSFGALLPKSIRIQHIEIVSEEFHARFSVKEKTYLYLINSGEYDPFLENRAFQKSYLLDYHKMQEVASLFIGTHDFGSFNTASYDEYPNQVRTIRECRVLKKGKKYIVLVTGDGFLRHMVRIMVGAMVDVGRGYCTVENVRHLLRYPTKEKRRYNIDACGLYLMNIQY